MNVREEREAEGNHPLGRIRVGFTFRGQCIEEEGVHAACQQVVLASKVNIERGTTDLGPIENLRDCNAIVRLLADERPERFVQERARPLNPPVHRSLARAPSR